MLQLVKRSISGLVYAVVVMLAVFNLPYGPIFLALFFGGTAILEWLQFDRKTKISRPAALMMGLFILLIYRFSGSFNLANNNLQFSELLMAILLASLVLSEAFSKSEQSLPRLFKNVFGLVYVAVPLCLLTKLPFFKGNAEPWLLAGVFLLIWASDTFAYLVGKYFGKRKLAPKISPNKTWEGLIGGIVATLLIAAMANYFVGIMPVFAWLGLALVVIVFGSIGDLLESAIKRYYKIKDSGKFMPGHGGILDRIDSLLLATPMAYFYIKVIENYC